MTTSSKRLHQRLGRWRVLFGETPRWETTIHAYAEALFPANGPIPISGPDAGAVEFMRQYLDRSQPRQRRLIRLLIEVSEFGPLLFGPTRQRFSRLALADRERYLAAGFVSPLYLRRITVLTMRALLTMAYFANDEVLTHIGMAHDPDPFGLGSEEFSGDSDGRDSGEGDREAPAPTQSEVRLRADGDAEFETVAS
jgi:hypothetical protein